MLKGEQRNEGAGSTEDEIMWLRDLLPKRLPNARIASFSYESGWMSGGEANIRRYGDQLLEVLLQHRQGDHVCVKSISLIPNINPNRSVDGLSY
jgi:hypothetical protein